MDPGSGEARPALSQSKGRNDDSSPRSTATPVLPEVSKDERDRSELGRHDRPTHGSADPLEAIRRIAGLRRGSELAPPTARRPNGLRFTDRRLDDVLPGIAIAEGVRRIEHPPIPLSNRSLGFDRPEFADVISESLLALDTETTGLAGGTGTRAFVIGIAQWRNDMITVTQWLLSELRGESALLEAFTRSIQSHIADHTAGATLLSYNGKSYDMPLLRTRWRLARQPDPTDGLPHLDLLHPVRRAYRGVWENCRLATIERQLLGIVREDDLPGSEAPAAFTDWLRFGDHRNLVRVLEHNRQDVVSLIRLAARLGSIKPRRD